jgi:membrane-bound lytic murein transglycosylase B
MTTRFLIPALSLSFLALPACAATPEAKAASPQGASASPVSTPPRNARANLTQIERFNIWKSEFIARAAMKGYDRAMVERLILPAKIEERALERDKTQPEFSKPIWSYVDNAANASRLNGGRTKLAENRATFDDIEARYKVPRHILTSIWGLETAYGKIMGTYNPVDALATFAFEGRRTAFGENQLYALLDLLKSGAVRQDQLISSWAGAMGMTQFIPATFRDYAVDFDGDGNKDLWDNEADALGSAAHYLARHGWRWGEPVMTEVAVDDGFDYSLVEGNKKTVNEWTALGVRPIGGQRWSAEAGFLEAKLIAPGGHRGPKLLTFKNFDVIKKYNNSTSYAMGITVLGEALRGKSILQTDWPRADKPLSFTDKKAMQRKLNQLGFNVGGVDGVVGSGTRKGIRAWQKSRGLPADGYMEQSLFKRLMAQ